MSTKERVALRLPPLILRLVLAATFIWAGLGKVMTRMTVEGEDAALLANMGVIGTPAPPSANADPTPGSGWVDPPAQPADPTGHETPPTRAGPGTILTAWQDEAPPADAPPDAPATTPSSKTYSASDFLEPVQVRTLYGVSLLLARSASPPAKADGTPAMAIWPKSMAQGAWPRWAALALVVTELGGGVMMLLGLLTRFWALGLFISMVVAMWLTQIGPAVQSGHSLLGFLPDRPVFDAHEWTTFGWQLCLAAASLAVVFSGPGAAALDNLLFNRSAPESE